jgi:hypothetical protein
MWTIYKIVDTLEDRPVYVGTTQNIEKEKVIHFSPKATIQKKNNKNNKPILENEDGRYKIEKIDECESRVSALINKDTWDLHLGINKRYRKIDYRTIASLTKAQWFVSLHDEERQKFNEMEDKGEVRIPCLICGKMVKRRSILGHLVTKLCIDKYLKDREDGKEL